MPKVKAVRDARRGGVYVTVVALAERVHALVANGVIPARTITRGDLLALCGCFDSNDFRVSSASILTSRHSLDTPAKRRDFRGLGVVSRRQAIDPQAEWQQRWPATCNLETTVQMKPTQQLYNLGPSLWLDNIGRELLTSGTLARF